jgi:P-type E1-E2 ATPase
VFVVREEKHVYIDSQELLVGDILIVQIGDMMQVDGLLIEGSEVTMDESSITGESEMITKVTASQITRNEGSCFILSGSKIMDGSGKVLVCAVGPNTQMGKLQAFL